MGWKAITKDGEIFEEGTDGRPVQRGEEGELAVVMQEDYGHRVAIDLQRGIVHFDYSDVRVTDGELVVENPSLSFLICEETLIVGEMGHYKAEFVQWFDERGKPVYQLDAEGKKIYSQPVMVRNDIITPLIWRPIWFTRYIGGVPTKVIGAQTNMPEEFENKNVKKLIMLYADGKIGID